MRSYDVRDVFYLSFEIHYPWNRGLGPRAGSIKPCGENGIGRGGGGKFVLLFYSAQECQKKK